MIEQIKSPQWFKRMVTIGHHSRWECLTRPGEWCRGIGDHPGRCKICPIRAGEKSNPIR